MAVEVLVVMADDLGHMLETGDPVDELGAQPECSRSSSV